MPGGILDGLNEAQREAVTHDSGPLLIVAGAGTGKTTVITRRIAHLIEQGKARPEEILALTFTDKAADEMALRVDQLVPYGYTDTRIATFHAFGDQLIREYALELGLPPDVRVLSIQLQALDPVWSGVGGIPMDSGYDTADGVFMDAGNEVVVAPTSTSHLFTVDVVGTARPRMIHIEFDGASTSSLGAENRSLPEGVVGFTVSGALGGGSQLVVDTHERRVERDGANDRRQMTLRDANEGDLRFTVRDELALASSSGGER